MKATVNSNSTYERVYRVDEINPMEIGRAEAGETITYFDADGDAFAQFVWDLESHSYTQIDLF